MPPPPLTPKEVLEAYLQNEDTKFRLVYQKMPPYELSASCLQEMLMEHDGLRMYGRFNGRTYVMQICSQNSVPSDTNTFCGCNYPPSEQRLSAEHFEICVFRNAVVCTYEPSE